VVEINASQEEIGVVLMQEGRPIAFLSKKLGVKNQGLSTYEKELLALYTAISKWRHYLLGAEFVIKTNHINLKYLLEQRVNTPMQHKGLRKLLGLNYKIQYKKGVDNKVADALSRQTMLDSQANLTVLAFSELIPKWVGDIQQSYECDSWITDLKEKVHSFEENPTSTKYTEYMRVLIYKGRVCVGSAGNWRQQILQELHDSSLGFHSGITATYHKVKRNFHWPHLKDCLHQFVQQRHNYQLNKGEHTITPGLLQPLPVPEEAWTNIVMDFITGLPKSQGYEVILVVVDRLTKYAHFPPLTHPFTATTVAQTFLDGVYELHGLSLNIVSDRDPMFSSRF
jgi:RNase H-like domain found in reverse transcriptase/Integrase zinc binding domain